jgi:hypothetical protein
VTGDGLSAHVTATARLGSAGVRDSPGDDVETSTDQEDDLLWHVGQATEDRDERGWLVGHFVSERMRANHSEDVEIKWSNHVSGDFQEEWQASRGTSITILVQGAMDLSFKEGIARLRKQGDYAMWQPGVMHRWKSVEPTTVITIRWPSLSPQ